jgi:hypothetical protein
VYVRECATDKGRVCSQRRRLALIYLVPFLAIGAMFAAVSNLVWFLGIPVAGVIGTAAVTFAEVWQNNGTERERGAERERQSVGEKRWVRSQRTS